MNFFTFLIVGSLLMMDAVLFFIIGYSYSCVQKIKDLKANGWTIEPPKEGAGK